MKKTYVLDTNVLVTDPCSPFAFDEHDVCVIDITLEELDGLKNAQGETGANAREAVRALSRLRAGGSILGGVKLRPEDPGSGTFFVEVNHVSEPLPDGWSDSKADHRILRTCKALRNAGREVVLVTNDTVTQLKADIIGIRAEYYSTLRAPEEDKQYRGRREAAVRSIDAFYAGKRLCPSEIMPEGDEGIPPLTINEFLVMKGLAGGGSALGRFDGEHIVPLKYAGGSQGPFGVTPKNAGQRFAFEALMTPATEAPLVIIKGGAGTAKTFCSLAAGLEQVLGGEGAYRRMLIARPNIKFDEDIGFLRGSESEKIAPLIRPVMDNLEALMEISGAQKAAKAGRRTGVPGDEGSATIDYLFEAGFVKAEALAYFRGRSISRTYTVIDEAQNMSPVQAYGIVTRAGAGSKIVIIGDPTQIDSPRLDSRTNGLSYASEKMKGNPLCWQLSFADSECTRSRLAEEALARMSPKGARA